MKHFAVPLSDHTFKPWCLFCFPSMSQHGPATFQMLRGYPWPAAAILSDAEHPGTMARRQDSSSLSSQPQVPPSPAPLLGRSKSDPGPQRQAGVLLGEFQQGPGFGGICAPPNPCCGWLCCLTSALSPGPARAAFLPDGRPCLGLQVGPGDAPPRQPLPKGRPCVPNRASATSDVTQSPFL